MRYLLVLGAAALMAAGCGSGSSETAGTGETSATSGANELSLSATEFSFDPGAIQIDQPGTYTFTLSNDGSVEHALEIEGQGVEEETESLDPGSSGQVTVTFSKAGTYEFYCPVDGHRDQGMEGELTVGGASTGSGTTEDNGGSATESSGGYG